MDPPGKEDRAAARRLKTRCCVVGGGPAGMMLGFLLARAGIDTVILEKHKDFLRDFRGDTVHPSTLEVIYELGLLEDFLKLPHQELQEIRGHVGDTEIVVGDFRHTPTHCRFLAFMPQWDFLNFLARHGKAYPAFHLRMEAEATGLLDDGKRVTGVRARTPEGPLEIEAELVVGTDGRHSTLRALAGLVVEDMGSPIDVLWMRLPKEPDDRSQTLGYFNFGRVLVTLDRGDYWQCAFVIRKGGFDQIKPRGMRAFRDDIARIAPFLHDRLGALEDWDQIKLLTVTVDRLQRWYLAGLLCIGDAAHAMSPIGGIGINLAVQDAVAAANILVPAFSRGTPSLRELDAVQSRRMFPTRVTQAFQLFMQDRVIGPLLDRDRPLSLPLPLRLLFRWRWLRRFPARAIGIGIRPEHVKTPELPSPPRP